MSARTVERIRLAITPRRTAVVAAVLAVEAILVVGYFAATGAAITTPRHLVYPFVWLNVGGAAVYAIDPPDAPRSRRRLAAAAAAGYFVVLLAVAGLVGLRTGGLEASATMAAPGWGPVVRVGLGPLGVTVIPYMVAGYAALAYLGYAAVLEAASAAAPAVVGLVSCVGCTWPVVAAVLSAVAGSTAGVGSAIGQWAYGLSTIVFLLAVGLLYWRPGTG